MLFNSYAFVFLFLPAVWSAYWLLRRAVAGSLAIGFLIAASLFFYGWWNPPYLLLLVGSMAVNYGLCRAIAASRHQALLPIGVCLNLGLLGYFKYASFVAGTVNALADSPILEVAPLVLPLAISFYTFQQIAFLVDVGRGRVPRPSPLHYMAAVTFFPHLIAGPIVQYREMLPQFETLRRRCPSAEECAIGLSLFAVGLFKKLWIADPCGEIANPVFGAPPGASVSSGDAWVGTLAYTAQLYFDFSAYSDMALGLAHMLGLVLPMNFNSPYQSRSVIDFWRRWHMTLSSFLRDYLYFPLGGNRKGPLRRHLNLLITMTLGGLWHGAGWTFVLWGLLHGLYLSANHLWRAAGLRMHSAIAWPLTLLAVVLAWVPFRSPTMERAIELYRAMLLPGSAGGPNLVDGRSLLVLAVALAVALWCPNAVSLARSSWVGTWLQARRWRPALTGLAIAMLLAASILKLGSASEFLYFNF